MSGADLLQFQETLTHVPIADPLTEFAARLVLATHPESPGDRWGQQGVPVHQQPGRING